MNISSLESGWGQGDFESFEAEVQERICTALASASAPESGTSERIRSAPRPGPAALEDARIGGPATTALATLVASALRDPSRAVDLPRQTLELLTDLRLARQPELNLPGARNAIVSAMAADPHILSELADIIVDLADQLAQRARQGLPLPEDSPR